MRRIDLVCKLAGPFVIALVDGISTEAAILLNFAMNAFSIPVEYYAIARVYEMVPALRASKQSSVYAVDQGTPNQGLQDVQSRGKHAVFEALKGLRFYVQHRAFLPSFAGSLLYFTVLSFSGQMITYLLSVGYNSFHIAVARTGSVVFEISATWIAPLVMSKIGPIRAGIWFLSWQMLSLAAGACLFWGIRPRVLAATGLVGSTILSRIGLWGFDLSAQIIVQEVSLHHRTRAGASS
ncbi:hypothetical protein PRK78_005675 [Emydomyces testavorans]|uniref:Solute carrier family 40 member n=1 Tax=Emydomyces testavorans TaxID=2070801 RepID=A0AAF0IJS2_9EURO|nr:hypothetical protein PRK78_005675 [Emydomyces testavorans]